MINLNTKALKALKARYEMDQKKLFNQRLKIEDQKIEIDLLKQDKDKLKDVVESLDLEIELLKNDIIKLKEMGVADE